MHVDGLEQDPELLCVSTAAAQMCKHPGAGGRPHTRIAHACAHISQPLHKAVLTLAQGIAAVHARERLSSCTYASISYDSHISSNTLMHGWYMASGSTQWRQSPCGVGLRAHRTSPCETHVRHLCEAQATNDANQLDQANLVARKTRGMFWLSRFIPTNLVHCSAGCMQLGRDRFCASVRKPQHDKAQHPSNNHLWHRHMAADDHVSRRSMVHADAPVGPVLLILGQWRHFLKSLCEA